MPQRNHRRWEGPSLSTDFFRCNTNHVVLTAGRVRGTAISNGQLLRINGTAAWDRQGPLVLQHALSEVKYEPNCLTALSYCEVIFAEALHHHRTHESAPGASTREEFTAIAEIRVLRVRHGTRVQQVREGEESPAQARQLVNARKRIASLQRQFDLDTDLEPLNEQQFAFAFERHRVYIMPDEGGTPRLTRLNRRGVLEQSNSALCFSSAGGEEFCRHFVLMVRHPPAYLDDPEAFHVHFGADLAATPVDVYDPYADYGERRDVDYWRPREFVVKPPRSRAGEEAEEPASRPSSAR